MTKYIKNNNVSRLRSEYRYVSQIWKENTESHSGILSIGGDPGTGKTYSSKKYCEVYSDSFYISFKNYEANLVPKVMSKKQPEIFGGCETWHDVFEKLADRAVGIPVTVFFDDIDERNDKDEFMAELRSAMTELLCKKAVVFLIGEMNEKWRDIKSAFNTENMSLHMVRREFSKWPLYDSFRLYALTGGNYALTSQFDDSISFDDNLRLMLVSDSLFCRSVQDRLHSIFRAPETYNTLMYGMSLGKNRISELAAFSGHPKNKCDKYINSLIEYGMVKKEKSESGRTLYVLSNNYLSLWYKTLFNAEPNIDGTYGDKIISEYMECLEHAVKELFMKLVDEWVSKTYNSVSEYHITKNTVAGGLEFDYVIRKRDGYVLIKIFDNTVGRPSFEDWNLIRNAGEKTDSLFFDNDFIIVSFDRFSDKYWGITHEYENVRLMQLKSFRV